MTIQCAERGLLLNRVRGELSSLLNLHHRLFESAAAFGVRTALSAEQRKTELEEEEKTAVNENTRLLEQIEQATQQLNEADMEYKRVVELVSHAVIYSQCPPEYTQMVPFSQIRSELSIAEGKYWFSITDRPIALRDPFKHFKQATRESVVVFLGFRGVRRKRRTTTPLLQPFVARHKRSNTS